MVNGDFVVNFDDIKLKIYMKEEYDDRRCKYKRRKLIKDGIIIYMWYRICVCEKYVSRGQEYENKIIVIKDGVDVYYEESCIYEINFVYGWCLVKYYEIKV